MNTYFRMFPWIVDIFYLSPYHFYKVIEIIVREEEGLSRDVVKHLNHVSNTDGIACKMNISFNVCKYILEKYDFKIIVIKAEKEKRILSLKLPN